jgi:hypothetical protein
MQTELVALESRMAEAEAAVRGASVLMANWSQVCDAAGQDV